MKLRRPDEPPPTGRHGRGAAGVGADRLDAWVDAGLIEPPRPAGPDGPELDLRDATLVRSVCGRRASPLRATLDRLHAWQSGDADPPAAVTLVDARHGRPPLVRLGDGSLADPTGQFRLDFAPGPHAPLGRIGPTTAADWHGRGVDLELAGDRPAAVDCYARALLLGGPDPQVAFDLAHALACLGEVGRATERYRQVVELDPRRADAWVNLGDLLLSAGDVTAAVDAFRRALDLDPDDPAAHYDLAEAFDQSGQPRRATPHWAAFLRLTDRSPSPQTDHATARLAGSRAARPLPGDRRP